MTTQEQMKRHIITLLDALPAERLAEVVDFVEFLRMKQPLYATAYTPIALGGLWPDVVISDEDISEVRGEMWHRFGEREE